MNRNSAISNSMAHRQPPSGRIMMELCVYAELELDRSICFHGQLIMSGRQSTSDHIIGLFSVPQCQMKQVSRKRADTYLIGQTSVRAQTKAVSEGSHFPSTEE